MVCLQWPYSSCDPTKTQMCVNNNSKMHVFFSFATAADVRKQIFSKTGVDVSVSNIKFHRKKAGFEACPVKHVPFIRNANQEKRLIFANMLETTEDTFDDVIFTDETSVQVTKFK